MTASSRGEGLHRAARSMRTGNLSIVTTAVLTAAAGVIPVTVVPALYPQMAQDIPGFTPVLLGASTSAFFGASLLTAPLMGGVADRLGARTSTRLVAIAVVSNIVLILLAPTASLLLVVFAMSGVAQSLALTASNVLMGAVLGSARSATYFGFKQSAPPVLSMLAGAGLAAASAGLGWRVVVCLFAAIPALLFLLPVARAPRQEKGHRQSKVERGPRPNLARVGRFALLGVFGGLAISTVSTFTVVTLVESGLSEQRAGTVFAVVGVLTLIVRIGSGSIADRVNVPAHRLIVVLLAAGCCGSALIATSFLWAVITGVFLAYALGWGYPGLFAFEMVRSFPLAIGRATGLIHMGQALGITSGPLIYSFLHARIDISAGWVFTAIAFLGALLAAATLHRGRPAEEGAEMA